MTLRKYGTGEVIGAETAEGEAPIAKTASNQGWDADDEQALVDEQAVPDEQES